MLPSLNSLICDTRITVPYPPTLHSCWEVKCVVYYFSILGTSLGYEQSVKFISVDHEYPQSLVVFKCMVIYFLYDNVTSLPFLGKKKKNVKTILIKSFSCRAKKITYENSSPDSCIETSKKQPYISSTKLTRSPENSWMSLQQLSKCWIKKKSPSKQKEILYHFYPPCPTDICTLVFEVTFFTRAKK